MTAVYGLFWIELSADHGAEYELLCSLHATREGAYRSLEKQPSPDRYVVRAWEVHQS